MWSHIKLIRKLKEKIPLNIKNFIIRIIVIIQYYYFYFLNQKLNISDEKRTVFILFATDYPNLGDHALTYAQEKLIRDYCPNDQIIEISVNDTFKYFRYIKKYIKECDIITIKGGGNIGIEYFREELYRRKVIKEFNNKIIIFPQTIYFPKNNIGKKELNKSKKIYSNKENLHLFVRDKYSYNLFKDFMRERLYLCPDIVFYLVNSIKSKKERKGILIALRDDVEIKHSIEERDNLIQFIEKHYKEVVLQDTVLDYKVDHKNRKKELFKILRLFNEQKYVITDRLHGMVFAVITQTPCIVLNNYNYKVQGQYEWIKNNPGIILLDFSNKKIFDHLDKFIKDNIEVDEVDFSIEYRQIIKLLHS